MDNRIYFIVLIVLLSGCKEIREVYHISPRKHGHSQVVSPPITNQSDYSSSDFRVQLEVDRIDQETNEYRKQKLNTIEQELHRYKQKQIQAIEEEMKVDRLIRQNAMLQEENKSLRQRLSSDLSSPRPRPRPRPNPIPRHAPRPSQPPSGHPARVYGVGTKNDPGGFRSLYYEKAYRYPDGSIRIHRFRIEPQMQPRMVTVPTPCAPVQHFCR